MKALVYNQYGSPEYLKIAEVDKPVPKEHEVLVKIKAASINSWDYDLLTGKPAIYRLFMGLRRPKYKIMGSDIAGVVEATGKNATKFKIGDEVYGDVSPVGFAAFAEYKCAAEDLLAFKPASMTFEQAAATPQAATLALQGLRDTAKIQPGMKVLINGAGGGTGTFALQMALYYGAEVTTVDRESKLDKLLDLGAKEVIDFTKEKFTQLDKQYDIILDVIACYSANAYKKSLNNNGILVVVGGKISTILQTVFLGSWIGLDKGKQLKLLMHKPNVEDLNELSSFFEKGIIKPVIDREFALDEGPEAFRFYSKGDFFGKIVFRI